jgi:hypothetical protein
MIIRVLKFLPIKQTNRINTVYSNINITRKKPSFDYFVSRITTLTSQGLCFKIAAEKNLSKIYCGRTDTKGESNDSVFDYSRFLY